MWADPAYCEEHRLLGMGSDLFKSGEIVITGRQASEYVRIYCISALDLDVMCLAGSKSCLAFSIIGTESQKELLNTLHWIVSPPQKQTAQHHCSHTDKCTSPPYPWIPHPHTEAPTDPKYLLKMLPNIKMSALKTHIRLTLYRSTRLYLYTCMHAIAISKREAMNLKESYEGYIGGFGGR